MAKGRPCPRNCGRIMFVKTQAGFNPNPISKVDGTYICLDCYVDEVIAPFTGLKHEA